MATTSYSNQRVSKLRQNPCQVRPPENIRNLSASRRYLWVRTTVSIVWRAVSISESELQATEETVGCVAHPPIKVIKCDSKSFLPIGGLHEDRLCDTLQATAPANVRTDRQASLLHIESNLDRLGLLSPTHGQRFRRRSGQITLQSILINKPKFLKAICHAEIRKNEIPRSMVVEALSW